MARLPQPGGDDGNWGEILNEYLSQSLAADGSVKPGVITKSDVGLGNVDNTSDLSKPVSTNVQTALDDKLNITALNGQIALSLQDEGSEAAEATKNLIVAVTSDGVTRTPRVPGDGKIAAVDWRHTGDNYLVHKTAKTGSSGALDAWGTDDGTADAQFISHKAPGSVGQRLNQQPGAGFGRYSVAYSTNAIDYTDIYKGAAGHVDRLRTGQGFADGVTTAGSPTLTSATAGFTSGDIGRAISQLTSTGVTNPFGSIPSGATIVSVQSATSVTMSASAGSTATSIRFRIADRPIAWDQRIYTAYDTDGTTVLGLINQAGLDWRAGQIDRPAAKFRGKPGQTGNILETVIDGSATPALQVGANGRVGGAYTSSWNNAGATGQNALQALNYSTVAGVNTLFVKGVSGQVGDQIHIEDSAGAVQSRFDASGRFATRVSAAPADAAIANGECFIYFDPTPGSAGLRYKGKDSSGTVVSGSL